MLDHEGSQSVSTKMKLAMTIAYRGLISAANSAMVESLPKESEIPTGISDVEALSVTPVGHSLVIIN